MPERDADTFEKADQFEEKERVSGQLHIRLLPKDTVLLRKLARDRDQTLSATVRFLLYRYLANGDPR